VTASALRAALARPALLSAEQAATVARTLGVDAATMRALRRTSDGDSPGSAHASTPGLHAAAPSTLDLLDRVLRAVRGDAAGLALRAAVLDVAAEAARAAGRPLPPGAHALRARLATPGGGESTAGGGTADDAPEGEPDDPSPEAAAADAAALVRDLQRTAPGYDDLFAPLHDDALADLLARHALAVHAAPGVPAGTRTVLTPPLVGRRRLVLAAAATADAARPARGARRVRRRPRGRRPPARQPRTARRRSRDRRRGPRRSRPVLAGGRPAPARAPRLAGARRARRRGRGRPRA
jgi:hypothetical protein